MRHILISFIFAPMIAACSTLVTDDPTSEYAPENLSKSRSGIVGYNPNGLKDLVNARRNDSYKKIVQFCGSKKYKITKEDTVPADEAGAANGIATFGAQDIHQMHFVCE